MSSENPYESPSANLSTDSPERRTIQALYDEQNGVAGAIAAAVASLLIALLWSALAPNRPLFTPMILVVSGILIGVVVRWIGRPVTSGLRVMAMVFQLYTCFLAVFVIGAPVVSPRGMPTPVIVYIGLVIAGAVAAYWFSARPLDSDQKRILWRHDHSVDPPRSRTRNGGWIMFAVGILSGIVTLAASAAWVIGGLV